MKRYVSIPPVYFTACILLCLLPYWLLPTFSIITFPWNLCGAFLIMGGFDLLYLSLRQFKKHGAPERYDEEMKTLVPDGPYRFSRNPQFLSGVFILLGLSIILGNAISFLSAALFILLMEIVFIRSEERRLHAKFGQSYAEYKKRVRRWM